MPASRKHSSTISRFSSNYWIKKKPSTLMLQSLWSQVKRNRHWKNGCKSKKQVINFPADKIHIISALNQTKVLCQKVVIHSTAKRAQPSRCRWKNSEGLMSVWRFQQLAFLRWHASQERLQSPPLRDQDPLGRAHLPRETHHSSEAKCTL